MKVLQVISSVSPRNGGPSRAIADIEQALTARGVDVTTVATDQDGPGRRLGVRCGEAVTEPHATRWYFPVDIGFYTVSFGLARWLADNVGGFDVVHVHALFSFAPVAAAWLARRARVPYVVRPLGVLAHYGMTQRRPLLKKLSFALFERRLLQDAAAVQFTSRFEQNEAASLGLKCSDTLIPLGIDVAAAPARRPRAPGAPFELLFIGRIDPVKNLESVIVALASLRSSSLAVHLKVAGEGDAGYVATLKALAARQGIAGAIEWVGNADGERKKQLLLNASAFVLPSHSESFGIAAVEALAAGLPCIVSRQVAVADDIQGGDAGFVTGTDAASIAAGIRTMIARSDRHGVVSAAAHRLAASRFSRAMMGDQLVALYETIAANKARV
jgi:glycosyltransferase involved in cell wall biosynthesis